MKVATNYLTNLEAVSFPSNATINSIKSLSNDTVPPGTHHPVSNKSTLALLKGGVSKNTIEDQDPFYIADLGEVARQYKQWTRLLPRVKPYYAVKCNPDPMIISTLANLGTGFDVASKVCDYS
jgi:ornithine decarboxylase